MWMLQKFGYRTVQLFTRLFLACVKVPQPRLLSGAGSLEKVPQVIKENNAKKLLIVSGKHVSKTEHFQRLMQNLEELSVQTVLFTDVSPNPTSQEADSARRAYNEHHCDGILAFGGGSPMDCAKAAAALVATGAASAQKLAGMLKVHKKLPPFFAVPTTSGSGSETTVAAVITDTQTHRKYVINDFCLVPHVAVLDPVLTVSLPPDMTAATGMDALTHAVEAYIGRCSTRFTDEKALQAVASVYESLESCYKDGANLDTRNEMAQASYNAGLAFTRAFVGYVHAIAHALGGLYNVPHGLANAIVLPTVLEFYGPSAQKRLAQLAIAAKTGVPGQPEPELAKGFIESIRQMNRRMNIPETVRELKREDIPLLASRAVKEGNPSYPVPKIMSQSDCESLLMKLIPKEESAVYLRKDFSDASLHKQVGL